ncbi:MAG: hypothetical protein ACI9WU_005548 [Myxococcota bacterium]|jgi:hypothetical protein
MRVLIALIALVFVAGCGSEEAEEAAPDTTGFAAPQYADAVSADTGENSADTVALALDTKPPETPDVSEPEDIAVEDSGPADIEEPEDLVEPTPDPGPTQTDPGGGLDQDVSQDCDALNLPTHWVGEFDGEIVSSWGDVSVQGVMGFEIGCLGQKLVVWGEMSGFGEGQPFTLKIQGGYNPESGVIKAKLIEGSVQLFWILPVAFEGDLEGDYDGSSFSGLWSGTNTDKTILDASGDGTWTAEPQ